MRTGEKVPGVERLLDPSADPELHGLIRRTQFAGIDVRPPEQQRALTQKIKTEKLTAPETECAAVHMLERTWNKSPQTRAGTIRRFVIGGATVEVKFRRSGVADPEVLDVLRRASKLVEQQLQEDSTR